jgi:allophanate hydrolase subunit 2
LRPGDVLRCEPPAAAPVDLPSSFAAAPAPVELRVVGGPQADALDEPSMARLTGEEFMVSKDADRAGVRLEGPLLRHRASAEILSDGMPSGSIQVPPDGAPILMTAEAPTTGGYVKPLVILSADLPRLGQLVPGETRVRFRWAGGGK